MIANTPERSARAPSAGRGGAGQEVDVGVVQPGQHEEGEVDVRRARRCGVRRPLGRRRGSSGKAIAPPPEEAEEAQVAVDAEDAPGGPDDEPNGEEECVVEVKVLSDAEGGPEGREVEGGKEDGAKVEVESEAAGVGGRLCWGRLSEAAGVCFLWCTVADHEDEDKEDWSADQDHSNGVHADAMGIAPRGRGGPCAET